jgi:hypothetical protein
MPANEANLSFPLKNKVSFEQGDQILEKICPKRSPTHICQYKKMTNKICPQKVWLLFKLNKTGQSEHSPNRRKFSQSGRPAFE